MASVPSSWVVTTAGKPTPVPLQLESSSGARSTEESDDDIVRRVVATNQGLTTKPLSSASASAPSTPVVAKALNTIVSQAPASESSAPAWGAASSDESKASARVWISDWEMGQAADREKETARVWIAAWKEQQEVAEVAKHSVGPAQDATLSSKAHDENTKTQVAESDDDIVRRVLAAYRR